MNKVNIVLILFTALILFVTYNEGSHENGLRSLNKIQVMKKPLPNK